MCSPRERLQWQKGGSSTFKNLSSRRNKTCHRLCGCQLRHLTKLHSVLPLGWVAAEDPSHIKEALPSFGFRPFADHLRAPLSGSIWVQPKPESEAETSRNILVQRVPYDDSHALALHACIARRQVDEKDKAQGGRAWCWAASQRSQCLRIRAHPIGSSPRGCQGLRLFGQQRDHGGLCLSSVLRGGSSAPGRPWRSRARPRPRHRPRPRPSRPCFAPLRL